MVLPDLTTEPNNSSVLFVTPPTVAVAAVVLIVSVLTAFDLLTAAFTTVGCLATAGYVLHRYERIKLGLVSSPDDSGNE